MFFISMLLLVMLQRIIELIIAKRNEQWAREQGAVEYGEEHYKYIVMLHVFFFLSLMIEYMLNPRLIAGWPIFFIVFLFAQIMRIWSLRSLGKQWNTKVLVIPNAPKVTKGPYRFLKHPNYVIVSIEIVTLPIIFGAFITAVVFSFLNFALLKYIRIPVEELALKSLSASKQK